MGRTRGTRGVTAWSRNRAGSFRPLGGTGRLYGRTVESHHESIIAGSSICSDVFAPLLRNPTYPDMSHYKVRA